MTEAPAQREDSCETTGNRIADRASNSSHSATNSAAHSAANVQGTPAQYRKP